MHCGDQEASAEAGRIWGRKVKHLAYVWNHLLDHDRDYTRHELMSLILIAGLKPHDRLDLFLDWRDKTLSYEDVRARIENLRASKEKPEKAQRFCKKCGEPI